jgi:phosphoribosylamine--glycine ligase/phosphoribosylaminoimidazole synthetase
MKILLVGSGGREHAIAVGLATSKLVDALFIAPGNAGTAALGSNVAIAVTDVAALASFAVAQAIDLVVVGPEVPLALGLVDAVTEKSRAAGKPIPCFGPVAAAARLESSKAFSKELMSQLGIPTAAYGVFSDFSAAAAYVMSAPWPVVVKASGLAAGKGVFLPDSKHEAVGILYELMAGKVLGDAGLEVVVEERLSGEEVSVMAFCDGERIAVMPSAQDHKRLLDGDLGPNTGGMGAYAPAPLCSDALAREYASIAIEPVVREMARRGTPFIGVLYAGIIVTSKGPRVLEYNCRFGDPETQAVLPLFEGDLAMTLLACARGDLRVAAPAWKPGSAACVVMASEGYPEAPVGGAVLAGLESVGLPSGYPSTSTCIYHAGTALENGQVVAKPGRVLGVTAIGADLQTAIAAAYAKVESISFPGARYRHDIGGRGIERLKGTGVPSAYAASGVDIDAGNEAVRLMSVAVKATYTEAVLAGIGSFGGLFDASDIKAMKEPVLVVSTDGVGTKVKLAAATGSYAGAGMDIVNHCIDDILVQGARPLLFLDYIASSRLDPRMVAEAVGGMAAACKASGCVLIGGETAEMPGVYQAGEFDVAGTIVGLVEKSAILPSAGLRAGDAIVGFRSDSPHTNGYSLIRKILAGASLDTVYPEIGLPIGKVLLTPHRSYLPLLWPVLSEKPGLIKALAHITGGGFMENIPRILLAGLEAVIRRGSWPVPPLYPLLERLGGVEPDEMYRVFNMGIGMVAVVDAARAEELFTAIPEQCWILGELADQSRLSGDQAPPARTRLV